MPHEVQFHRQLDVIPSSTATTATERLEKKSKENDDKKAILNDLFVAITYLFTYGFNRMLMGFTST